MRWYTTVYLFDCKLTDDSYIMRCPVFIARWVVRRSPMSLDYAPTTAGL